MATQDHNQTPSDTTGTEGNPVDGTNEVQLAQATPAAAVAANVVTVTPPAPGGRVVIQVEPGQTILLQGINIATAQIQQVEGGLQITLANGAVIFLAGFVQAAQDANPPVIEIAGLGRQGLLGNEDFSGGPPDPEFGRVTISAADLLAAARGQPLDLQPAAGPAGSGGGDGGGQRFADTDPQDIGDGLDSQDLLSNEDFGRSPPPPVFGETIDEETVSEESDRPTLSPASGTVVEDELPEGGSLLDPESETGETDPTVDPFDTSVTGALVITDGSITALSYSGALGAAGAAVDGGATFSITASDGSWTIVVDKTTGEFTFELLGPLDHADPDATFGADTLSGVFTATVTGPGGTVDGDVTITIHDDAPTAAIAILETIGTTQVPLPVQITLDESLGADAGDANADADDNVAGNTFPAGYGTPIGLASAIMVSGSGGAFGADGPGTTEFSLNVLDSTSGLSTTDGTAITLFEEANGDVTGRIGGSGGTVIFAISIGAGGEVSVAQYDSLAHGDSPDNFDETVAMVPGKLEAVSTVVDADGDSDSASADIGENIIFEDDGPVLDIDGAGQAVLTLAMDESIVLPVSTSDESGSIPAGADDTLLTAPNGTDAFGSITTGTGDISSLFTDVVADPGSDGEKDRSDAYTLTLRDAAGALVGVPVGTFEAAEGVETTLSVSDSGGTIDDQTIILFQVSDTVIEGRVDLDNDGVFESSETALRFTLDVTSDPDDPSLTVEQILALEHPTTTDHDEAQTLAIAGDELDASAGINVSLSSTLTDGDDDTASDSASVNITGDLVIEDDGPVAVADVAEVNESLLQDFNIVITFDRSTSMRDDPDGVGGFASRLALAKAAVADLLAAYEAAGSAVNVLIVDFASTAATSGWTTVAGANAYLAPLVASGSTNYEAATNLVQSAFPIGTPAADANVLYFLTDGEPTLRTDDGIDDPPPANPADADNLTPGEQATWEAFLDANVMTSFGVGMGSGGTVSGLEPVTFPGDPIVVTTESELSATLVGTVPPPNTVDGTVFDTIANDDFGSDGPAAIPILSLAHDGLIYTLADLTGGDGDPSNDATLDGDILTIPTALGGTLSLDFMTGEYTYTAPSVSAEETEIFTYTVVDADGDSSSATLTISVLENDAPVALGDSVITNITDGSEIIIPDVALVANDTDPEGDPLEVFSTSGAVSGTLSLGASLLPYVGFTPSGPFPAPSDHAFEYIASDGQESSASSATVTITGDVAGALDGTGAAEILIAGDGDDTILAGGGSDFVIGGKGSDAMTGGPGSDTFIWSADHVYPPAGIILSTTAGAALGGLVIEDGDLARYDPMAGTASVIFDEDAVGGLTGDGINAVHVLDNGNIVLSTDTDASLPGLGAFENEDLVEYNPSGVAVDGLAAGEARAFLDGDATFAGEENIDALHVLDNGNIVLSTTTDATIGALSFDDGDLVEFNPSGGTVDGLAAGSARHYGGVGGTDGFSTLFAADEDIDAAHVLDNGNIVLSTDTDASLAGLGAFENEDLVEYNPSGVTVDGLAAGEARLFLDGDATFAGEENIDAAHVVEAAPWADTITDFTVGSGGDVLHFADVFDGGAGDGLSLAALEAGGFIDMTLAAVDDATVNDTVISIDADGSAGTAFASVVVVNVLDVTLTSADTDNFVV